jgi:hypothetical protein
MLEAWGVKNGKEASGGGHIGRRTQSPSRTLVAEGSRRVVHLGGVIEREKGLIRLCAW